MGTSRVAIAGGAFRVRTGNLCTMFRSLESAAEQIALLHDEIERLKARLREQTLQTQQTAEQIHSAVIEALGDAIPDGIDANGHPTEQVVATTISTMRCDHEMLKDEIERLNALAIRAWHSFRSGLSFDNGREPQTRGRATTAAC